MEHYDRPPILRKKRIFKIVLMVFLPIFFGSLLFRCLDACIRLPQARKNAQLVSAVIYDVKGDEEYDVHIRYRYNGETYDVLYKSGTTDGSWKDREGQSMTIQIDASRPGMLIERMEINAENTVFALGFFNLWLLPSTIQSRKKWTEVYGNGRNFIQLDLKDCVRRRCLWKWGLLTGAGMIAVRVIFREDIPGWAALLGAVLLLLGLWGMKNYFADLKKISNEEFSILKNTVTEKGTSRSRGSTKFYLKYTNENGSWDAPVSGEEYQAACIGQVRLGVFLPGERRPMLLLTEQVCADV